MTDDAMIEKIARALWIAGRGNPELWDNPWSAQWVCYMEDKRPVYRKRAQAVAAVLSEAMVDILAERDKAIAEWLWERSDKVFDDGYHHEAKHLADAAEAIASGQWQLKEPT